MLVADGGRRCGEGERAGTYGEIAVRVVERGVDVLLLRMAALQTRHDGPAGGDAVQRHRGQENAGDFHDGERRDRVDRVQNSVD